MMRLFNRRKSAEPVIVVSGLPRSGTSLMMQMLRAGGVPLLTDDIRHADQHNPRGYYEYQPVKRLKQDGADWMRSATGKAVKIVSPLLFYLPPDYDYRVIFMWRDVGEVVRSQAAMIAPRPMDSARAEAEYHAHLDKVRGWLAVQPHITTCTINHQDALRQPSTVARRVADFLARQLATGAMCSAVDPGLYRTRETRP
ncbi:MAG: sulfotransferase family protein [Anaerolineaceae bacterium]|nr:MAG: sulfotransferase family protein [Anaerolineaceae bacterium]